MRKNGGRDPPMKTTCGGKAYGKQKKGKERKPVMDSAEEAGFAFPRCMKNGVVCRWTAQWLTEETASSNYYKKQKSGFRLTK